MAETDDPQEDLQVVAMTAGAAGARVAETVIRARQNALQNSPNVPGGAQLQPASTAAVTRDPDVVKARQVANAMNGRPAAEAARTVSTVQPARTIERIRVREPERSR